MHEVQAVEKTAEKDAQETIAEPRNTLKEVRSAMALLKLHIAARKKVQDETIAAMKNVQEKTKEISSKLDLMQNTLMGQAESRDSLLRKSQRQKTDTEPKPKPRQEETILILGGMRNGWEHVDMAVLSSDRSRWIQLKVKLPSKTGTGGAAYLNGELYIFGGFPGYYDAQKLDKNMKWTRLADMNVGRTNISKSCMELNGFIWVFGGCAITNALKSVERYDPKTNTWTMMLEMKYPRYFAAATVWNGKIVISGGRGRHAEILRSVECFDPKTGLWTEWNEMPTPRSGHAFVTYENRLIAMGGCVSDTEDINSVVELNPVDGKWKQLASMKLPAAGFPAAVLDEQIYAIGGLDGDRRDLNRVEKFSAQSSTAWYDGPALPYKTRNMPALVVPQSYADLLLKQ